MFITTPNSLYRVWLPFNADRAPVHEFVFDQVYDVAFILESEHLSWSKPWLLTDTCAVEVRVVVLTAKVAVVVSVPVDPIMCAVVDGISRKVVDAKM